ncbi:MAG: hypothetical protein QXD13_00655 [Candidatus Pacearchaeota archaeon]
MPITTIKLSTETKARLDNLRLYKRETYEEILLKLLGILNICRINPEKAKSRLLAIERRKKAEKRMQIAIQKMPQKL